MRFAIFIFISTSLALLIPSDHASSSVEVRDVDASPIPTATQSVSELRYPYTKKVKITLTKSYSTTPLATRAVSTSEDETTSSCTPHSICVDKISPCGKRYGGCYDENFCDGNRSPYPIPPACPTMVTVKRAAAEPAITPA